MRLRASANTRFRGPSRNQALARDGRFGRGVRKPCIGLAVLAALWVGPAAAQEWPQILGPHRNGSAPNTRVAPETWPAKATVKWEAQVGGGYAGVAISDGRVFAFHRESDSEVLSALDLATGQQRWTASWSTDYVSRINPDSGPRCVPTVSDGKVISYGAAGDLVCVSASNGEIVWQRRLRDEYRADDGYFGAGSSPLVTGQQVIVCLGGQDAGIVSIDLGSGETRWVATDYDASYAAPILVSDGVAERLLVVTRLRTVLLSLDGDVLSEIDFGSRGPTVNAATPIALQDKQQFFLTASYGIGALRVQIADGKIVELSRDSGLLASQYNTPVRSGSTLFGIQGREDAGVASLRAINANDLSIRWEHPGLGTAHLVRLDNCVMAVTLTGDVVAFDSAAETYRQLGQTTLPGGTYRSLPALAGQSLIVRSSSGARNSKIVCVELP